MPAKGNAQRRGRPRRQANANSGGISGVIRNELVGIIGVCETCNRPLHSLAPIATEMDVAPVILAGFVKGTKGLAQETLDKVYDWVEAYKANPHPLNEAPATETASA